MGIEIRPNWVNRLPGLAAAWSEVDRMRTLLGAVWIGRRARQQKTIEEDRTAVKIEDDRPPQNAGTDPIVDVRGHGVTMTLRGARGTGSLHQQSSAQTRVVRSEIPRARPRRDVGKSIRTILTRWRTSSAPTRPRTRLRYTAAAARKGPPRVSTYDSRTAMILLPIWSLMSTATSGKTQLRRLGTARNGNNKEHHAFAMLGSRTSRL